ncbi:HD-GYP domain-containing protein [Alkalihalobacterium sp. APHAB7]|uniref:HD-GYP domain-containing protein n=1 Tax=Alkalihalobacterium sp. APHAB7 TaxID=3402081 RepID=UPI003AADBE93
MSSLTHELKIRGDHILLGLTCLMTLGVILSLVLYVITKDNTSLSMLIGFTFCSLFHWAFYCLHRQFNKNTSLLQHITAGTIFLLFFFVALYNPLNYIEMWVYLLYFPIVLGLLENEKVFRVWGALFLVFYSLFLLIDPTLYMNMVVDNMMMIVSRFLFGLGSLVFGFLMVKHLTLVKKLTINDTEIQSKEHVVYVLNTLVPIVETKTQTSRSEIDQSSQLMKKMAAYFPEERIEDWEVELLSLAHYVSRVQWPDYLFEKGDKLTSYEFKTVQEHCLLGAKLLGNFEAFERIRTAFLNHHERIDGSGYPYGLKERDISVLSQILGVVETFLAMTKPRVYRDEFTLDEAFMEIENMSGEKFSADVVAALVTAISDEKIERSDLNIS